MIKRDTELQITSETAIAYSTCYRLPFLSLFHADCMEIMKQYPDKYFDLAIVDPPYGIDINKSGWIKQQNQKNPHSEKNWDKEVPTDKYFLELKRVSKNQIIWGGNYFNLEPTRCFYIWDKVVKMDQADCELAWTSFEKSARIFTYAKGNESGFAPKLKQGFKIGVNIHPTQKPIALYEWLLKHNTEVNFKILDTHFGSGSIALAVDKANRLDKMNLHLTACEIDKEYIDKAIKRISESIKQGTLSF